MSRERPKPALRKPGGVVRTPVSDEAAAALEARLNAREHEAAERFIDVDEEPDAKPANPPTAQRPDEDASPALAAALAADTRNVLRKGRLRADGSRTPARVLRRLTVYIAPELGDALDVAALSAKRDKGDIAADAIAEWLAKNGGSR